MYVNEQKSKSVFFWWKTESFQNEHLPRVKMAGLDADKKYKIHELNRIDLKPLDVEGKTFSGAYLMSHGLEMPYRNEPEWSKKNDWSSRVLLLEAE
jgi:alpha-galactosidase